MCYQVEVLELQDDKAIITVGESKFIAYHDTDVSVEEGFDDCWSYSRECHYTRPNGKYEVDARTILNSLHVIVHEDGDEEPDILFFCIMEHEVQREQWIFLELEKEFACYPSFGHS